MARIAEPGSEEEKYFCDRHLENHTYAEGAQLFRQDTSTGVNGDGSGRTAYFVPGGDVNVIIVKIKDVRISDWKGTVRDWALEPEANIVNGA